MTEREWIALAERRVLRILGARRFASIRQLEKKIAEAGPADIRPEPVKISAALKNLIQAGLVVPEPHPDMTTFYKPRDFGTAADQHRRDQILALTQTFLALARDPALCGRPFEQIVKLAAYRSAAYHVVSSVKQGLGLDGYVLDRECDHILFPRAFLGPAFVVEDKNLREWLTPSSREVWALIGRALRVPDSVPVLICRRMHYVAFGVFRRIGLVCWQVYSQYFSRSVESQLVPIRHKDGLGFSDVTTSTEPPAALVRFFGGTLRAHSDTFRSRFNSSRRILEHYAIECALEDERPSGSRPELFEEFRRELQPPPGREEPGDFPHDGF